MLLQNLNRVEPTRRSELTRTALRFAESSDLQGGMLPFRLAWLPFFASRAPAEGAPRRKERSGRCRGLSDVSWTFRWRQAQLTSPDDSCQNEAFGIG